MKQGKQYYYNISWLIRLLKEQEPDRKDIINQLEELKQKKWVKQPYIQFYSALKPNQPDGVWQYNENIVLEHETEGTIILDILKDGRIGGIEFLNQIAY